jgi:hypothetical protein
MPLPAGWERLGFTSGRRTHRGNKLVGGVKNSDHLHGTAADFTAPLSAVRAMFPNARILDEGDHRHVSGLSDVPYHGNKGIAGLVNGVDTTAPKAAPPMPNFAAMSRPMNGFDPLAPQDPILRALQASQPPMTSPPMQPNFAAMSQPQGGADPLAPKPKRNALPGILGILGDALAAYGGQRGVFTPMMMQQRQDEREDNRARERLNASIEAQRELAMMKAQMPQKPSQTERLIERLRDPRVPTAERQLIMQILTKPLVSFGEDGSQTSTYGTPGDDEWEYSN